MTSAALAVVLLACAASAEPRRTPQTLAGELDRLAARQEGLHPHEARALERRMRALGEEARRMGASAIEPLSKLLAARERQPKARLYAAQFLGLNGDPSALGPLQAAALDESEDAGLRSAALQALTGLRVTAAQKRRIYEAALGADAPPRPVRAEAIAQLADLGSGDPDVVLRAAGARDLRAFEARDAARAIAQSGSPASAAKLAALLPLVARHAEGELEALGALARHAPTELSSEQAEPLFAVLRRRRGASAGLAARVLGRHRVPGAVDELRRTLAARDPLVVTEAAEALAAWRDPRGARAIERLVEGLAKDARFAPKAGLAGRSPAGPALVGATGAAGRDVAALAERLHAAAAEARAPLTEGPQTIVERLPDLPPSPAEPPPPPKELPPQPERLARRGAFRLDGWPGLERPQVRWKGGDARLFERPEPDAPSRRATLPAGPLAWDQSVVWTLEEGVAVVGRALTVEAVDLGTFSGRYAGAKGRPRTIHLRAGETLGILGVRGEGTCYVRRRTRLLAMECPQFYPGPYEVARQPVTEWWVRVDTGRLRGWLTTAYRPGTGP
ncbi:MAG: HEAT repeat domain-containing protein [Elusimicrobia bacterium]|nr:HEAT repeat domain-containing protein [Elusimicrobiota bacterium]